MSATFEQETKRVASMLVGAYNQGRAAQQCLDVEIARWAFNNGVDPIRAIAGPAFYLPTELLVTLRERCGLRDQEPRP